MKVNEIFLSIQGEGKYTGYPTVFLRLTGCNLRCNYCDTKYSYDEGYEMTSDEIYKKIISYNVKRVCITGGEPLLQDIKELLFKLSDFDVSIETNGSIALKDFNLSSRHNFTMDLKVPSSGFADFNLYENLKFLNCSDEIKFVIATQEDYEWVKEIIKKYGLEHNLLISVVYGTLKQQEVVKWILNDNLDIKFQLQLHKFIWDVDKRGV